MPATAPRRSEPKATSQWLDGPAGKWSGGRVWLNRDGERVYIIRKTVRGKTYEVSTHCHHEAEAEEHFRRFLSNPATYDPRGGSEKPVIRLDGDLTNDFLVWSKNYGGRGGKGTSDEWRRNQRQHLDWWMAQLAGKDLRKGAPGCVTLGDDIVPALKAADGKRVPSYRQRIVVLKTLYSWLREVEHRLEAAEDPTFGTLKAPQSKAAMQEDDDFKVIHIPTVLAVVKELREKKPASRWADMLLFLLGTGWHVTELRRFMMDGSTEPIPEAGAQDPESAGVLVAVCVRSKRGNRLKTRLTTATAELADKLKSTGGFLVSIFYKEIAAACIAARVEPFRPCNMRHTLATYAENHGAAREAVQAFLNHVGEAGVLMRHYSRGVALRVPTPR